MAKKESHAAGLAVRAAKAADRARELAPIITELREGGTTTLSGLADGLNARGIPAPRGGRWRGSQVYQLLARIEAAE